MRIKKLAKDKNTVRKGKIKENLMKTGCQKILLKMRMLKLFPSSLIKFAPMMIKLMMIIKKILFGQEKQFLLNSEIINQKDKLQKLQL